MGSTTALFGNAHTVDPSAAQQDYARLLGQNEQVHAAYQLIRDTILFTDAELKIWISGSATPIQKTFAKGVDTYEVQAILTQFVAKLRSMRSGRSG
ncbi:PH domain-containing protein [Streptomyces turgidiscabies]|uniref:Bacterial Pleckstrin homology domain-containing protein n=1 Tax=Streptomyces turgidiscabies TaxID=85558 RepID=A0ABU0RQ98_9ACTN|nr:PH domain-containing protein [Streptomyces turgidiscabies]MDQ0934163.1 hypothetical protein [Streptomyces turgidiscabies]